MTRHAQLDNVAHKDLRVRPGYGPGMGFDALNATRVFPVELVSLQAEYPLFFVPNSEDGNYEIIALLGIVEGKNLYVSDSGWTARSIPLTIERAPFLIGFQSIEEDGVPVNRPVVHVDLDHPKISTSEGEPIFLPQGGESELLQRAASVLKTIHEGHAESVAFSKALVGLELIEPLQLTITRHNGERHTMAGLHTISEERLKNLEGPALEALHRQGCLQAIYMMLASLQNMAPLIERAQ
jgi:hypothetical protein